METPSRRTTRSSTLGPSSAGKTPGTRLSGGSKKKELQRLPFTDLTNDSPIAGLIPAKTSASSGCVYESTPRPKLIGGRTDRPIGEDLLRMQVTTLLRKVESEAAAHKSPMQTKVAEAVGSKTFLPASRGLFESPMRLAAPTPANTPLVASGVFAAAAAAQVVKGGNLPTIVVASPISSLNNKSRLGKILPSIVATEQLSTSEASRAVDTESDGHVQEDEEETPLTRTLTRGALKFDSPAAKDPQPKSGGKGRLDNPTVRFELPPKTIPDAEIVSELFTPSAHPHPRRVEQEDEDSWSVIVNVDTPEKPTPVAAPEKTLVVDVPISEVDVQTMKFLRNVPVNPEVEVPRAAADIPALWESRDNSAVKKCALKDDEEYEDCEEEYDDEEYEEDEEEECYASGKETLHDGVCECEWCDELCKGLTSMNVGESVPRAGLPEFRGKHIRFVYNSDDEIEEEDVVCEKKVDSPGKLRPTGVPTHVVCEKAVGSPRKLRLAGVPTPIGTHTRFDVE